MGIFLGGINWRSSLALVQILVMGIVLVLPIQYVFDCHYLGGVDAEINTLTYDEAHPNFFFDHYNLNPIEDIENQLKKMDSKKPFGFNIKKNAKLHDLLKMERNNMVSGNIFLKAMKGNTFLTKGGDEKKNRHSDRVKNQIFNKLGSSLVRKDIFKTKLFSNLVQVVD